MTWIELIKYITNSGPYSLPTFTTHLSTMESSHSMYDSMGDCSSRRWSNSWYTGRQRKKQPTSVLGSHLEQKKNKIQKAANNKKNVIYIYIYIFLMDCLAKTHIFLGADLVIFLGFHLASAENDSH